MSGKWKITLGIGAAVVALLVGGVVVTGYALAQQPTAPLSARGKAPPEPWDRNLPGPWMGQGHGRIGGEQGQMLEYRDQMGAAVAEALGISVEELEAARAEGRTLHDIAQEQGVDLAELQAALESPLQGMIEQAVADGVIPEAFTERITEYRPPVGWMLPYHDQMEAAVAEKLGISVEELETARAEGKTPVELAEKLGVDLAELHKATEAARQEIIEQAVEDGVLTPEQAERIGQRPGHGWGGRCDGMRQGFGPDFGPSFDHREGGRRMGPGRWLGPDAPDSSE